MMKMILVKTPSKIPNNMEKYGIATQISDESDSHINFHNRHLHFQQASKWQPGHVYFCYVILVIPKKVLVILKQFQRSVFLFSFHVIFCKQMLQVFVA